MKTIIRNGKKYTVTNSLYNSIKKSKLDEWINPFAGANNTLASNPQSGDTAQNNTEQGSAIVQEFNNKYGNKIINNLQEFIDTVKNIKSSAEEEKTEISKKRFYDNNKFAVIANVLLNACKNDFKDEAWVSNLLRHAKEYNTDPGELLVMNITPSAADVARAKGYIPMRDDESAKKIEQYFTEILKNGNLNGDYVKKLSSSTHMNVKPIVDKTYNELKQNIISKAEEENKNLSANQDDDPSNNIDLVDSIEGILNKENEIKIKNNAIEKIVNSPNIYSKIKNDSDISKISQKIIRNDTMELLRATSNAVEKGESTLKNPKADPEQAAEGILNIVKNVLQNVKDINNVVSSKDRNKKFQEAVSYVDSKCELYGDEDDKINKYCEEASKHFKVNKDELLNYMLNRTKKNSNLKKLASSVKDARDYNEVLNSSLEYKNPLATPIIDIINYFYEEITKKINNINEASSDNSKEDDNQIIQKLTNFVSEYHKAQIEVVNNIKNIRKIVNNPDSINTIVDEINEKKESILDSQDFDNLIQSAKEAKSTGKKVVIDYNDIEDAKSKIEYYINRNSAEKKDLDILNNNDKISEKFKTIFNNKDDKTLSVFNNLLNSYRKVGKAVVIGCFLDNASNYASKKPKNNEDNSKNKVTKDVIRAFRKFMDRNINYEDEELYNDVKLQCEAAVENSEVFLKDAKALFRELYPFPVPFFTKKKKLNRDQMRAFESGDDKDKIQLYDQIIAYDTITKWYNKLTNEEKDRIKKIDINQNNVDSDTIFEKLIVNTVPEDKSKQINKDVINKLNFEFQALEYSQLNNFYTELSNDTRITNNYKIRQIYKQKAFEQHDRFLIVFTKNGNFICTLKLVKILGKTRNVLGNLSNSDNPKYKVDRMFNKIKNAMKVN